jgi:Tol biopolymer transport system component
MNDEECKIVAPAGRSRWLLPVAGLEFVLALFIGVVVWRLMHTPKPLLASEERAFTRLAWVNASGRVLNFIDLRGHYVTPSLSSNAHIVLLTRLKPGGAQIWILSTTDRQVRALSPGSAQSALGIWSPRGDRLGFSVLNEGRREIFERTGTGISRQELSDDEYSYGVPESWSPDGKWLAFTRILGEKSQIWLVQRNIRAAHLFLESAGLFSEARFSPDGKYIALTMTKDGLDEVYAAPVNLQQSAPVLPENELIRISPNGGSSPQWGADSNELFFVASDRSLMLSNGHPSMVSPNSLHRLFSLALLGAPHYQYRFGGYCIDVERNAFIAALEYVVH